MRKNTDYIYLLNVVSALAVVALHTNGCFWAFAKETYWDVANILESVFYFAVPCFFMSNGVTLLNYRERYSTKIYFKKRVLKTFIPFLVWSLIGLLYRIIISHSVDPSSLTLLSVFNGIFRFEYIAVYWFFQPLFVMY